MLTYAKTTKGIHEIEHRSHEIHPQQRRLLILIDGKRSAAELEGLFHGGDLQQMLAQLEVGGYIQRQGGAEAHAPAIFRSKPPASVESAHAAPNAAVNGVAAGLHPDLANLPATRPPDALLKAKNFIINTISHFHSYYAWLDLKRAVQEAHSHDELRGHYAQWLESMQESRQAAKRLDELKRQLLDVL